MLKKFMIEKVDQKQLSETKGIITFHLVDENGDCRTVSGSTFLNEKKEPQGISTDSVRELPLMESLFSNRHKKTVEVEFEHFNKVYNREKDQTINQIVYEEVIKIKNEEKLSNRFKRFFKK